MILLRRLVVIFAKLRYIFRFMYATVVAPARNRGVLLLISLIFAGIIGFLLTHSPGFGPQRALFPPADSLRGPIAQHGMVVSAHPLASEIGRQVLQDGGNAVDAAIAVQFALAVVYPAAGNIGGGGFLVLRNADGSTRSLDFREMAPAAASRNMYLDKAGNVIDGKSFYGHQAAGVPGTVAGMFQAHRDFGAKLPMNRLIQPAIDLATKGFPLTEKEAASMNRHADRIKKYNTKTSPYTRATPWKTGDTVRYPDLAQTLMRVRDLGEKGFYAGETADLIVAEMKRGGGIMTHQDLLNYKAVERKPLITKYKGYEIIGMAPPSSGGVALAQLLQMVEPYNLGQYPWHSPEAVHLMVEAEKRVYADRAAHLGDPDFWPVPVAGLIDSAYCRQRMANVSLSRATPQAQVSAGKPTPSEASGSNSPQEHEETTHFSIIDAEGNAVSVTTTLNGAYGCYTVVAGAGFFLNNEMDDFSVKPGTPNAYGLVGAEANAVAPKKRMLSSMTPTIIARNGKLQMVVGTPGGSTIITSVFQTVLNVLEWNMTMQQAVSAKRFHHQWKPKEVLYEEGCFTATELAALTKLGHTPKQRDAIGRVDAILVLPDGRLEGGADPRGDDAASGW